MTKIFIYLLLVIQLFSCSDSSEKSSIHERGIEKEHEQFVVAKKDLDTMFEIIRYPESLTITKDSLILQIRNYTTEYDFDIIDTVFLIKNLISSDNQKGKNIRINFPFDIDSSKFEFFTSPIDSTVVDLNKYSFFKDAAIFYNEPRKYRGGPCYFRLINKNGDNIEFDGETIESIDFISKISPHEYIMLFNSGPKYLKGYTFSIGVLNISSLKENVK